MRHEIEIIKMQQNGKIKNMLKNFFFYYKNFKYIN